MGKNKNFAPGPFDPFAEDNYYREEIDPENVKKEAQGLLEKKESVALEQASSILSKLNIAINDLERKDKKKFKESIKELKQLKIKVRDLMDEIDQIKETTTSIQEQNTSKENEQTDLHKINQSANEFIQKIEKTFQDLNVDNLESTLQEIESVILNLENFANKDQEINTNLARLKFLKIKILKERESKRDSKEILESEKIESKPEEQQLELTEIEILKNKFKELTDEQIIGIRKDLGSKADQDREKNISFITRYSSGGSDMMQRVVSMIDKIISQGEEKQELTEDKIKEEKIKNTKSFDELFFIIREIGVVKGSEQEYSAEFLIGIISRARIGEIDKVKITRKYGIREKVLELLQNPEDKNIRLENKTASDIINEFLEFLKTDYFKQRIESVKNRADMEDIFYRFYNGSYENKLPENWKEYLQEYTKKTEEMNLKYGIKREYWFYYENKNIKDIKDLGRFYINSELDFAQDFLKSFVEKIGNTNLACRIKIPSYGEDYLKTLEDDGVDAQESFGKAYNRKDKIVIYFDKQNYQEISMIIKDILDSNKDKNQNNEIPLFTKNVIVDNNVLNGVGFGDEPAGRVSFGQIRSNLLLEVYNLLKSGKVLSDNEWNNLCGTWNVNSNDPALNFDSWNPEEVMKSSAEHSEVSSTESSENKPEEPKPDTIENKPEEPKLELKPEPTESKPEEPKAEPKSEPTESKSEESKSDPIFTPQPETLEPELTKPTSKENLSNNLEDYRESEQCEDGVILYNKKTFKYNIRLKDQDKPLFIEDKEWFVKFDDKNIFSQDGFVKLMNENKYNLINKKGEVLLEDWVDYIYKYNDTEYLHRNKLKVDINGKTKKILVNQVDGELTRDELNRQELEKFDSLKFSDKKYDKLKEKFDPLLIFVKENFGEDSPVPHYALIVSRYEKDGEIKGKKEDFSNYHDYFVARTQMSEEQKQECDGSYTGFTSWTSPGVLAGQDFWDKINTLSSEKRKIWNDLEEDALDCELPNDFIGAVNKGELDQEIKEIDSKKSNVFNRIESFFNPNKKEKTITKEKRKKTKNISKEPESQEDKSSQIEDNIDYIGMLDRIKAKEANIERADFSKFKNIEQELENDPELKKLFDALLEKSTISIKEPENIQEDEVKNIIKEISQRVGIDEESLIDVYNNQKFAMESKIFENVSKAERKKLYLKMGGYLGAAGAFTLFTVLSGGIGTLGLIGYGATMGAIRVIDTLLTDKHRKKELKEQKQKIQFTTETNDELYKNLIGLVALKKQLQLKGVDLNSDSYDIKVLLQSYVERTYPDKSEEEKESIIRSLNALYKIDQNNSELETKFLEDKKSKKVKETASNFSSNWFSAFLSGGKTTQEKITTIGIFTSLGICAREVPILRNVLLGIAGYKLGGLVGELSSYKFNNKEIKRAEEKLQEILTTGDEIEKNDYVKVSHIKANLLNSNLKEKDPTKYLELVDLIKSCEEKFLKQKDISSSQERAEELIKNLEDNFEKQIKKSKNREKFDNIKKWTFKFGFAAVGASLPTILKSINDSMQKQQLKAHARTSISEEAEKATVDTPKNEGLVTETPPTAEQGQIQELTGDQNISEEMMRKIVEQTQDQSNIKVIANSRGLEDVLGHPIKGNVTVINPDGTRLENFDANLHYKGDIVVEDKLGNITVFRDSMMSRQSDSLVGVYEKMFFKQNPGATHEDWEKFTDLNGDNKISLQEIFDSKSQTFTMPKEDMVVLDNSLDSSPEEITKLQTDIIKTQQDIDNLNDQLSRAQGDLDMSHDKDYITDLFQKRDAKSAELQDLQELLKTPKSSGGVENILEDNSPKSTGGVEQLSDQNSYESSKNDSVEALHSDKPTDFLIEKIDTQTPQRPVVEVDPYKPMNDFEGARLGVEIPVEDQGIIINGQEADYITLIEIKANGDRVFDVVSGNKHVTLLVKPENLEDWHGFKTEVIEDSGIIKNTDLSSSGQSPEENLNIQGEVILEEPKEIAPGITQSISYDKDGSGAYDTIIKFNEQDRFGTHVIHTNSTGEIVNETLDVKLSGEINEYSFNNSSKLNNLFQTGKIDDKEKLLDFVSEVKRDFSGDENLTKNEIKTWESIYESFKRNPKSSFLNDKIRANMNWFVGRLIKHE